MSNFKLYKPSSLEEWINKKYLDNHIICPSLMDIEIIASIFNIQIATTKVASHAFWDDDDGFGMIYLNAFASESQRRAEFFHELCHPLKHSGDQRKMPDAFRELQEIQANCFQLYAAIPYPLLQEIDVSSDLLEKVAAEEFNLPPQLVRRRMEQIENRITTAKIDLHGHMRFKREDDLRKSVGADFVRHGQEGIFFYSNYHGLIKYMKYQEMN